MLRDADPRSFAGVYVVCGFTDLRYGIDSLAAIIERKYQKKLFVPNTLFLFWGKSFYKDQRSALCLFPSVISSLLSFYP